MEIWKDVSNHKNIQVSNMGKIRNTHYNGSIEENIKEYKPNRDGKGYLFVRTIINGEKVNLKVHRLVAQAFIPNPNNLPQVNHKNGIKVDNRVENLEWCTNQENIIHAIKNNLRIKKFGKESPNHREIVQFDKQGNFIKNWDTITEAAKALNLSVTNINNNLKKRSKTAGGFIWKHKEEL